MRILLVTAETDYGHHGVEVDPVVLRTRNSFRLHVDTHTAVEVDGGCPPRFFVQRKILVEDPNSLSNTVASSELHRSCQVYAEADECCPRTPRPSSSQVVRKRVSGHR